jgi:predicted TPR repeat methyltransferase
VSAELISAIRAHQNGDLERAEAGYRKVLAASPDDPDALHYLGVLLHRMGDSEGGARLVRKAIARSPDYADAHKNLGNILAESGAPEKAEKCYRKAIALDDTDADAYSNLSIVLRHQKRHEAAVEAGLNAANLGADKPVAWLVFGHALKRAGMYESAVAAYYRALELDRGMVEAHTELGHTLYLLEKISDDGGAKARERIAAYREWLKADPDNPLARFMLAACSSDDSVARMPDEVVKKLFDSHAAHFDQNLASLDYRVPDLIGERAAQLRAAGGTRLAVLDAGCGTGLCAPHLRPLAAELTGVDLSAGMLRAAQRRKLYDELVEAELTVYLQSVERRFDLVVCADTLCYFGELETVFAAVAPALKPGGRFLFSVEHRQTEDACAFGITSSGRYSHTAAYVRDALERAGLAVAAIDEVALRQEGGTAVAGLLVDAGSD